MNKHIVIINGFGRAGKDSFVHAAAKFAYVMNFSSVDKIKKAAKVLGWDGGKSEKDRKFLSDMKDLSTTYNDCPFQSMREKVSEFYNSEADILFLHIREPEEIERAKKEFNAHTLLIIRNSVDQVKSNHADANVFDYDYEFTVLNDGDLTDLAIRAKEFVEELKEMDE